MKTRLALAVALVAASGAVPRLAAQAPDAPGLYSENCKKCHGVIGIPPKTMKAKYSKIASFDAAFLVGRNEDSVEKVLTRGAAKSDDMKPFKDKMSKDEIGAVAKYVIELAKKAH